MSKKISRLSDLIPDPTNPNEGTERGLSLLDKSIREYGAGRSIVADKNGVIIAGNKTLDRAAELELPIEVVHTRGNRLVVVVRDDLDLLKDKDGKARGLSIADNRVAEVSMKWDLNILSELKEQNDKALSMLWSQQELAQLLNGEPSEEKKEKVCPNCGAKIQ